MFLQRHSLIRGIVLGLMFFLAGTAYCSSDSYDPDPYDDIPPVVTVEFNYIVPSRVNIRRPNVQVKTRPSISFNSHTRNAYALNAPLRLSSAERFTLIVSQFIPAFRQNPSHMLIPLRC